jgi:hypothetical protein
MDYKICYYFHYRLFSHNRTIDKMRTMITFKIVSLIINMASAAACAAARHVSR